MEASEWCPLFGTLPSCEEWDGITEKCLNVIEDARLSFWGSFEYRRGVTNPDPARIEKTTGFPAAWIEAARVLSYNSYEIISDAQHVQGGVCNGNAWTVGHRRSYLTVDVDQLNPDILRSQIHHRALNHDFLTAVDDGSISPAMILSLMAIGRAWDLLCDIASGDEESSGNEAIFNLLCAEKLLKAAHASKTESARDDTTKAKHMIKMQRVYGSIGGKHCKRKKGIILAIEKVLEDVGKNKSAQQLWNYFRKEYPETPETEDSTRGPLEIDGDDGKLYEIFFRRDNAADGDDDKIVQKSDEKEKPINIKTFYKYVTMVNPKRKKV